ncbi:hypothetical protein BC567DRAFT_298842, partial [Phyllosticta citribraziliensis]
MGHSRAPRRRHLRLWLVHPNCPACSCTASEAACWHNCTLSSVMNHETALPRSVRPVCPARTYPPPPCCEKDGLLQAHMALVAVRLCPLKCPLSTLHLLLPSPTSSLRPSQAPPLKAHPRLPAIRPSWLPKTSPRVRTCTRTTPPGSMSAPRPFA